ncbi:hypothetical protein D3C78_1381040 [compost metagenome]
MAVQMALELDSTGTAQQAILQTARHTAAMYLMQFQHVLGQPTLGQPTLGQPMLGQPTLEQ